MTASSVSGFFAPGGPLASALPSYEPRHEQVALAERIEVVLGRGGQLVAEAGTGTGKSLAYLVPVLASGLKGIVSTATKALQEQLLNNDLPLLEKAAGRKFDVMLLKGRTNYLCESRLERAVHQQSLPGLANESDIDRLISWREQTTTGDRAELPWLGDGADLWRELTATSDQCTGGKCSAYETCWVTIARRRAAECQLVVVNHHLYFADAALRMSRQQPGVCILPDHDLAVFDEAHEVDDIAAQSFGCQVSEARIQELFRDALLAAKAKEKVAHHLKSLQRSTEQKAKQLFNTLPFANEKALLERRHINDRVLHTYQALDDCLVQLEALLGEFPGEEGGRLRERAAGVAAELAFILFQPPRRSMLVATELQPDQEAFDQRPAEEKDNEQGGKIAVPFVRYSETRTRYRFVVARPLDVAPVLQRALSDRALVMVSATVAVSGKLEHFKQRVAMQQADELLVNSPFDFQQQARLYLPRDLPAPDQAGFSEAVTARALALVQAAGGGAFVLCTSHRMLAEMQTVMADALDTPPLVQGSAPRTHLLDQFRDDGHAVLLATMSFWRGVDVPGSALRLVVIDRLPFASPADPIVAGRIAHLQRIGRSPFSTFQLPHAALLLRQGFGRLIRRQSDTGMVAILDKRISTKGYGKVLLRSLPDCPVLGELGEACDYLRLGRDAAS